MQIHVLAVCFFHTVGSLQLTKESSYNYIWEQSAALFLQKDIKQHILGENKRSIWGIRFISQHIFSPRKPPTSIINKNSTYLALLQTKMVHKIARYQISSRMKNTDIFFLHHSSTCVSHFPPLATAYIPVTVLIKNHISGFSSHSNLHFQALVKPVLTLFKHISLKADQSKSTAERIVIKQRRCIYCTFCWVVIGVLDIQT